MSNHRNQKLLNHRWSLISLTHIHPHTHTHIHTHGHTQTDMFWTGCEWIDIEIESKTATESSTSSINVKSRGKNDICTFARHLHLKSSLLRQRGCSFLLGERKRRMCVCLCVYEWCAVCERARKRESERERVISVRSSEAWEKQTTVWMLHEENWIVFKFQNVFFSGMPTKNSILFCGRMGNQSGWQCKGSWEPI